MATKAVHLAAIKSMRLSWSSQDSILITQLADLRYKLERERAKATRLSATVLTAAGNEKANPVFGIIDKLAIQETQLTKRLGLQAMVRNAAHNYELNANPTDKRSILWAKWGDNCITNLFPGAWLYLVRDDKCVIDEDELGWPNNPKSLPVAGQVHEVGNYYPLSAPPAAR